MDTRPRRPDQGDDLGRGFESEFCYRAWKHGYRVGLTNIPAKLLKGYGDESYIFPGGTLLWGRNDRERNEIENKRRIKELYDADLDMIQRSAGRPQTPRFASARPGPAICRFPLKRPVWGRGPIQFLRFAWLATYHGPAFSSSTAGHP
jgi:hypothetical protein